MNKIRNKAEFEIKLCDRKHVIATDEHVVEPIKVEIELEKPCRYILEKDKIRFVYKIRNESKTDIFDSKFRDILNGNADYVQGSFEINGCKVPACIRDNTLEASIKELPGCTTLIVSFEVKTHEMKDECRCHNRDNDCKDRTFFHACEI